MNDFCPNLIKKHPVLKIETEILKQPRIILDHSQAFEKVNQNNHKNSIFYPGFEDSFLSNYRINPEKSIDSLSSIYFENDGRNGIIGFKNLDLNHPKAVIYKSTNPQNSKWEFYLDKIRRKNPLGVNGYGFRVVGHLLMKIMDRGEYNKNLIGVIEVILMGEERPVVNGPPTERDNSEVEDDVSVGGLFGDDSDEESGEEEIEIQLGNGEAAERMSRDNYKRCVYSLKIMDINNMRIIKNIQLLNLEVHHQLSVEFYERPVHNFKISKNKTGGLVLFHQPPGHDIRYLDIPWDRQRLNLLGEFRLVELKFHPDLGRRCTTNQMDIISFKDIYCHSFKLKISSFSHDIKGKVHFITVLRKESEVMKELFKISNLNVGDFIIYFTILDENFLLLVTKSLKILLFDIRTQKYEIFKSPSLEAFVPFKHVISVRFHYDRSKNNLLYRIKWIEFASKEDRENGLHFKSRVIEASQNLGQIIEKVNEEYGGLQSWQINPEEDKIMRVFESVVNQKEFCSVSGCFCCDDYLEELDLVGVF